MAWYRDLEPCTYFGVTRVPLLAVGWLEAGHEIPQGPIPPVDVLRKLARMLDVDVSHGFLGWHDCEFCRLSVGPRELQFMMGEMDASQHVSMGIRNLFVPAGPVAYVAPSLVFHYLDSHGYGLPQVFVDAVQACPDPSTPAYRAAVLASLSRDATP
ncbi:MAG: hypothetical protein JNJ54_33905 [Myxococcaceae bacterium]|nr:hypothetical protein [Myxococcaceae bacterium]